MGRYAFQLRLRENKQQDYIAAHKNVWPELLELIKQAGVSNFSIFLRGQTLFLYLEAEDFEHSWKFIRAQPIDKKWSEMMAPLFEPVPDQVEGEDFAMMQHIFFLA